MRIVSKNTRDYVRQRWPICCYCRREYGSGSGQRFTVDHLVPLSRGGSKSRENLIGCCGGCNMSKGCRTPEEWLQELAEAVREIQAMQGEAVAA